ncbi:MAG: twin-arginine translocation signal domain-containing protein [Coriobacteriia bacterium]|nr:twin-arginine translocation signal domain-containing protein [Coriobacteriia bacterium]
MATRDQDSGGKFQLSRRDFVKVGAAAAAAGAVGVDWAVAPSRANAADVAHTYSTTCPYCSAQCGQQVDVAADGTVLDIYGDPNNPTSRGGLCAKGAGAYQLVTNERRIGVSEHTAAVDGFDFTGQAWKRVGDSAWTAMTLDAAMTEIAPKLVAARGPVADADTLYDLFTAGDVVDEVTYTGFSGLTTIKLADGSYMVATNGNKATPTELAVLAAGLPGSAAAYVAAFDGLVFKATDPAWKASYTFVGRSDLGAKMLAAGVFANTADIVVDAGVYYAYVVAVTGEMHVLTSPDMLVWTYDAPLGKPASVGTMTSPTVLKSGANLKVWYVDIVAQKLQYASFDGSAWSAATNVTVGGSDPIWFVGHPVVSATSAEYTLYYVLGSGGIKKAIAPVATPAVFAAATNVYDGAAKSEGNVSLAASGICFSTYAQPDDDDIGWAYSDIKGLAFSNNNNARTVMFFGSSHMNNEPNNLYRKIIATFGTSLTEHQARI